MRGAQTGPPGGPVPRHRIQGVLHVMQIALRMLCDTRVPSQQSTFWDLIEKILLNFPEKGHGANLLPSRSSQKFAMSMQG
jgi:hypothetical protein